MKRQPKLTAMRLARSLRSARPTRLRKLISVMLVFALVFVPLFSGRTRLTPTVAAQGPIIICGGDGASDPNRIIQQCPLYGSYSIALENEVINELLAMHQLPASDRSRLLGFERDLIRAGIFNKILGYVQKEPSARTAAEQFFVNNFTDMVKQRRILVTTSALDEYNKWQSYACGYTPPPGFEWNRPCACVNQLCAAGFNLPPSLEEFQNYGASIAYAEFRDKPELRAILLNSALQFSTLGGFTFAAIAGTVGGALGSGLTFGSGLIKTIFPFAARTFGAATATGAAGSVSVAGPLVVLIVAIVTAVIAGIMVFKSAEIPGKLLEAKNNALNK